MELGRIRDAQTTATDATDDTVVKLEPFRNARLEPEPRTRGSLPLPENSGGLAAAKS